MSLSNVLQQIGNNTKQSYNFRFRIEDLFPAEPYAKNTKTIVRAKLLQSDAFAAYPAAKVSNTFVDRVCKNYCEKVWDARAQILVDNLLVDYDATNINRQAVIDCAKTNHIYYFLSYEKEKMINNVMGRVRKAKYDK